MPPRQFIGWSWNQRIGKWLQTAEGSEADVQAWFDSMQKNLDEGRSCSGAYVMMAESDGPPGWEPATMKKYGAKIAMYAPPEDERSQPEEPTADSQPDAPVPEKPKRADELAAAEQDIAEGRVPLWPFDARCVDDENVTVHMQLDGDDPDEATAVIMVITVKSPLSIGNDPPLIRVPVAIGGKDAARAYRLFGQAVANQETMSGAP